MPSSANALLTLAEFKRSLLITETKQDPQLEFLINAVSDRIERIIGRRLIEQTYTAVRMEGSGGPLLLNRRLQWPIITLTSVTVETITQTLWIPGDAGEPNAKDVYFAGGDDPEDRWRLVRFAGWPEPSGGIVLTYTAGYKENAQGSSYAIPNDLKEAAMIIASDWYFKADKARWGLAAQAMQGQTVSFVQEQIPFTAVRLLAPYTRFFGA